MSPEKVKEIIATKVANRWTAEHTDRGHFYRSALSGKLVSSVTQRLILEKPHLIPWAVERGIEWLEEHDRFARLKTDLRKETITGAKFAFTDTRDDAGFVGSQAHQAIEDYCNEWIKGEMPADIRKFISGSDGRVFAAARSAEKIFKDTSAIPIATEILVGDEKVGSAGTLDMIVMVDGKLELWDWKSSNSVNDHYALQVSAYKMFFQRMSGLKISKTKIMHLSKNYDKVLVYNIADTAGAFRAFCAISKVYDWQENGQRKLERDVKKIKL